MTRGNDQAAIVQPDETGDFAIGICNRQHRTASGRDTIEFTWNNEPLKLWPQR